MTLPLITEIKSRNDYMDLIKSNPGLFIVKFGAEWCAPCKKIEKEVLEKIDEYAKRKFTYGSEETEQSE
mgnify:CR=1 FL=1